jgi:Xaa-Pro aminopeptidase
MAVHFARIMAGALALAGLTPAISPHARAVAQDASPAAMEAEYRMRRAALLDTVEDGVVLVPGAPEPTRDYETFQQSPAFFYLTGLREPDATLVMVKRGGEVQSLLYLPPRTPSREVWSGVRLGLEGATQRTGLPARDVAVLVPELDSLLAGGATLHVVGDVRQDSPAPDDQWSPLTRDEQLVERLRSRMPAGAHVAIATGLVERLRAAKGDAELTLIRRAADITASAHREAMQALEPGMNEYEIQALVEYTFRRHGADRPGFASIIGSGPNATTLHYNANDRAIAAGDMVVIDIGASWAGYSADITRTLPANGVFSPEQRAIYQLVRDGQAAAERQAVAGREARLMNDSASAVMARGLARLGLIDSAAATYDCGGAARPRQCRQLSLYYLHGLSHGIGLEVHDPDQWYFTGRIAAGSAFTIEPGLYVRHDAFAHLPDTPRNRAMAARLARAVARYQGIGVRIEDDYIVTERGTERISNVPREIGEIEEMMRAGGK